MKSIEPKFEVDERGRVICQDHTNFLHFINPDKDYFSEMYLDFELNCKKCEHYSLNECYFSKERIDEIEYQRIEKKAYRCKLCFNRIHRMFSVIYQLYNKEKYDIEIPLICCDCYDDLFKGEFKREAWERIIKGSSMILVALFFLFLVLPLLNNVFTNSILENIIVLCIETLFIIFILYFVVKKLKNDISGMIYYKKYLVKVKLNEIRSIKKE